MIRTPLTSEERLARVRENIARFRVPRLKPVRVNRGSLSICGFGPSLADTWKDIRGVVMTTSGAHDFLISRGVIPKYHVETDPREHKVRFVQNSHPEVTYLINSQCHPSMFDALAHRKVVMWHGFTDEDVAQQVALLREIEPDARLIAGGTNVGMRSIILARELGHTGFELHGMDCCYRGDAQWAGEHFTKNHHAVTVEVEGRHYRTSDLMLQSTDDFFNQLRMLPNCSFRIHGEGLLEARMKMFMRDRQKALEPGWWKPVDFVLREEPAIAPINGAPLISDGYRTMNAALHEAHEKFGTSGAKRAADVLALCRERGTRSVLDYGCGKGTLAGSLPFKIAEYDPCVPGKDAPPLAADVLVCSDVLEHIEPDSLHAVLADIQRLMVRTGYFVISTRAATKLLPDGRNAHLIQRSSIWWKAVLATYFVIDKWVALNDEVRAIVTSKIEARRAA